MVFVSYLAHFCFYSLDIQLLEPSQSHERVIHDPGDGIAREDEPPEAVHVVPGRGRGRWELIETQVQLTDIRQVGQGVRGDKGQLIGGDIQDFQGWQLEAVKTKR